MSDICGKNGGIVDIAVRNQAQIVLYSKTLFRYIAKTNRSRESPAKKDLKLHE